jgi:NHL repeat
VDLSESPITLSLLPTVGLREQADITSMRSIDQDPAGSFTDGDLYVSELAGHLIRRVTTAGVVTTYAGSTAGYADGAALAARFNSPRAVAVAANGDVLVADSSNGRIRRIVRNGDVAGLVETLAGSGNATVGSPDGVGTAAGIVAPNALFVRGNTLTVRDSNGLLRQIDLTTAVVTTLTGSRSLGEGHADGTMTTARIRGLGLGLTGASDRGFMLADDSVRRERAGDLAAGSHGGAVRGPSQRAHAAPAARAGFARSDLVREPEAIQRKVDPRAVLALIERE